MLISISQLIPSICQPCLSLSVTVSVCLFKKGENSKVPRTSKYTKLLQPCLCPVSVCFWERGKGRKKISAIGSQITLLQTLNHYKHWNIGKALWIFVFTEEMCCQIILRILDPQYTCWGMKWTRYRVDIRNGTRWSNSKNLSMFHLLCWFHTNWKGRYSHYLNYLCVKLIETNWWNISINHRYGTKVKQCKQFCLWKATHKKHMCLILLAIQHLIFLSHHNFQSKTDIWLFTATSPDLLPDCHEWEAQEKAQSASELSQ